MREFLFTLPASIQENFVGVLVASFHGDVHERREAIAVEASNFVSVSVFILVDYKI
jgi:hypothetical protein